MDNIKLGDYTLKLLSSVIYNTPVPKINDISLSDLYRFTRKHMVSSMIYHALKQLNLNDTELKPFYEDYKEFSLREASFSAQSTKLLDSFEKNEISVMPFKGSDVKKYYPKEYMRSSVDVDILIDEQKIDNVDVIMKENGFTVSYSTEKETAYIKKPYFSYEMHKTVIEKSSPFYKHFVNILKESPLYIGKNYIHKMSFEDMYIFSTVHFYKHFIGGGSGIRFLLDLQVLNNNLPENFNKSYVENKMKDMGIYDFHCKMSELAQKSFNGTEKKTNGDRLICKYLYLQGCFGSESGYILQMIEKKAKRNKSLRFFYFLWYKFMYQERRFRYYPILKKYYFLLPVCFLHRIFKSAFFDRKNIMNDYRSYVKYETFVGNVFQYSKIRR